MVRWPTLMASPRTDSIEDRAEDDETRWQDVEKTTLPNEIIHALGLEDEERPSSDEFLAGEEI